MKKHRAKGPEGSNRSSLPPLILVTILALLTACSSDGLDELKRLCEKDAGLTIYKTVEADGYYNEPHLDGGIKEDLIKGPYSFYEFCDDSPSTSTYNLFPEAGCFRVKRVLRNSGKCDPRIDKAFSRFTVEPYPEFLKNHCIAVEKIDKPRARYSYHSDLKMWLHKNGTSQFMRSDTYIKDTLSSEVIGRYVSYSHDVKPAYRSAKSCHVILDKHISFEEAKLINTVIQPIKE